MFWLDVKIDKKKQISNFDRKKMFSFYYGQICVV